MMTETTNEESSVTTPVGQLTQSTTSLSSESDSEIWMKVWSGDFKHDWMLHDKMVQLEAKSAPVPLANADTQSGMIFSESAHGFLRYPYVPRTVLCTIITTIRGVSYLYLKPFHLEWIDPDGGQLICDEIKDFAQTKASDHERIFKKTGRIRLLELQHSKFVEVDTSTFESESVREWRKFVPSMVSRYCGKPENEPPFILEIQAVYAAIRMHNSADHATNIRRTLADNERKNLNKQAYWSKKVINTILNGYTVKRLVNEDDEWKSLFLQRKGRSPVSDDCKDFIGFIMNDRRRLLAISLFSGIKLEALSKMFLCPCADRKDHGCLFRDENIPLSQHVLEWLLDNDSFVMRYFSNIQAGFRPWDLPRKDDLGSKHTILKDDCVVPIEQIFELGSGVSGSVWAVTIHGDYHDYSANKDQEFALKEVDPQRIPVEKNKEPAVLHKMARLPHDHITPFYTSWTQNKTAYILLPKADHDLAAELLLLPPRLTDEKIHWLMDQLYGLASAVQHLHNVGRAGLHLKKPIVGLHAGYHHDLKPKNILVFNTTWKIGDFGAAKIQNFVSGKYKSGTPHSPGFAGGDPIYAAPDASMIDGKGQFYRPGRQYDIWSLGCIFLEVLTWAFQETFKDLKLEPKDNGYLIKAFYRLREHNEGSKCSCQLTGSPIAKLQQETIRPQDDGTDDSEDNEPEMLLANFWYKCSAGNCHRKLVVDEFIDKIRATCKEKIPFLRHVCDLIRTMLIENPDDRPTASAIADKLAGYCVRATVNLHNDNKIFDQDGRTAMEVSSFANDTDATSRSNSRDRRRRYSGRNRDSISKFLEPTPTTTTKRPRSSSQGASFQHIGAKAQEGYDTDLDSASDIHGEDEPRRKRSRSRTNDTPKITLTEWDKLKDIPRRHSDASVISRSQLQSEDSVQPAPEIRTPEVRPPDRDVNTKTSADFTAAGISRTDSMADTISQIEAEFEKVEKDADQPETPSK